MRYLLEGSVRYAVRYAAARIHISAQFVDAVSGQVLWGARYDRKLGDDFAVQDKITRNIMRAIRLRVTPNPQRKPRLPGVASLLWGAYMVLTFHSLESQQWKR